MTALIITGIYFLIGFLMCIPVPFFRKYLKVCEEDPIEVLLFLFWPIALPICLLLTHNLMVERNLYVHIVKYIKRSYQDYKNRKQIKLTK